MTRPAIKSRSLLGVAAGVAAGVALIAATVSGCTSAPASHTSSPTPSAQTEVKGFPAPSATALANIPSKASDVKITSCAAIKGGGHRALGIVKNRLSSAASYNITIYFQNSQNQAVNWASAVVQVPAGTSVPWVAERAFAATGKLSCTIKAVS